MKKVYNIDDNMIEYDIKCPNCGSVITQHQVWENMQHIELIDDLLITTETPKYSKKLIYKCPCCEETNTADISDYVLKFDVDVGETTIITRIDEFGEKTIKTK